MDYSFKETAKQSLEELEKDKAREIIESVEELAEKGFEHDKLKLIQDRNGNWIYRLKVMKQKTNHRVFIDYIDNEIKILDILHREQAYEGKYGNP
jgi:mRNA-degrading endonuclease RelE of RelBE toxin-antitoxin system